MYYLGGDWNLWIDAVSVIVTWLNVLTGTSNCLQTMADVPRSTSTAPGGSAT